MSMDQLSIGMRLLNLRSAAQSSLSSNPPSHPPSFGVKETIVNKSGHLSVKSTSDSLTYESSGDHDIMTDRLDQFPTHVEVPYISPQTGKSNYRSHDVDIVDLISEGNDFKTSSLFNVDFCGKLNDREDKLHDYQASRCEKWVSEQRQIILQMRSKRDGIDDSNVKHQAASELQTALPTEQLDHLSKAWAL